MWASAFTGDTGGHKGRPYGKGVYRGIVGAGLVPARRRADVGIGPYVGHGRPQGPPLRVRGRIEGS